MKRLNKLINAEKCEYNWKKIWRIPEFEALKSCQQNPKWHKEGNADVHTTMVCNEAIKVARDMNDEEERLIFLAAALFHDIGKGTTTKLGKDGNWHSYGHDFEGDKITRYLLWGEDIWLRERICSLVRNHMEIEFIPESENFLNKLISISKQVKNLDMLIKLKECDLRGSIQYDEDLKEIEFLKLEETRETAKSLGFLYTVSNIPEFYNYKWKKELKTKNAGAPIDIVVPIGLSGAGKSTWIKENYPNATIISRDLIREELGYVDPGQKAVLNKKKEDKVSAVFEKRLLEAAHNGETIVLDNLNLKRRYRDGYKMSLSLYSVNWIFVYIEALGGIKTNMDRRGDYLDEDTLKHMIMSFDWPKPSEYDKFGIFTNGEEVEDDEKDYSDFVLEDEIGTSSVCVD